jgi:hypothetical protein
LIPEPTVQRAGARDDEEELTSSSLQEAEERIEGAVRGQLEDKVEKGCFPPSAGSARVLEVIN